MVSVWQRETLSENFNNEIVVNFSDYDGGIAFESADAMVDSVDIEPRAWEFAALIGPEDQVLDADSARVFKAQRLDGSIDPDISYDVRDGEKLELQLRRLEGGNNSGTDLDTIVFGTIRTGI